MNPIPSGFFKYFYIPMKQGLPIFSVWDEFINPPLSRLFSPKTHMVMELRSSTCRKAPCGTAAAGDLKLLGGWSTTFVWTKLVGGGEVELDFFFWGKNQKKRLQLFCLALGKHFFCYKSNFLRQNNQIIFLGGIKGCCIACFLRNFILSEPSFFFLADLFQGCICLRPLGVFRMNSNLLKVG